MNTSQHALGLSFALSTSVVCALGCGSVAQSQPSHADGGIHEDGAADRDAATGADASNRPDARVADASADSQSGDSQGPTTCGTRTGMRGLTSRSLTVGGVKRTYLAYLPTSLSATKAVPFVYVFHGFTMSGQDMYNITGYSSLADSDGFAVVFPDGEGGAGSFLPPWNCANSGQTVCGAGEFEIATGDDFGFMDAMKADVLQDQCLDASHVYSAGFSMGGYFTHHIACYRSDVRAAAPHSGGTIADLSACTTGHVPIIMFHGTSDDVIAEACDDPNGIPVPGFTASAILWAAKNGCQTTYSTIVENGSGGGDGQCYLYDGCPADGQVELCTFTGMSHCWAGGVGTSDACPTYATATELQWNFFKKYAW
jgi:polyhydroxybutyrate depolymerase